MMPNINLSFILILAKKYANKNTVLPDAIAKNTVANSAVG